MFSAVSSAFITDVQSKLEPDPNEMTAAYTQILIHAVNNSRLTVAYYSASGLSAWNMNASARFTVGCLKTRSVLLNSNELFPGG